jgi:hypothetical protein
MGTRSLYIVLFNLIFLTYSCGKNKTYNSISQNSFKKYRQFYDTIPEHKVYSLNRK